MTPPTITREQFQAAIEAGIKHAGSALIYAEREALRTFAAEHTGPVAWGCYTAHDGTNCPLRATGLDRYAAASASFRFYRGYDSALMDILGDDTYDEHGDIRETVQVAA